MAWVAHVRVDATVGAVCAAALLRGLVDLNVLDNESGGVETFGVGIGLGILEKVEKELGGLDRPAGFADAELLACGDIVSVCLDFRKLVSSSFKAC